MSKQFKSSGTSSLILGIIALLMCGIITGIPAILQGNANTDPAQAGMATAGKVMGWISVATSIIGLFMIFAIFGAAAATA